MQNSALYGEAYMCACRYASGCHVDCRKTAVLADRGILCVSGSWNMLSAPAERTKGKGKGTRQEGRAKEWRHRAFSLPHCSACRIGSSAERGGGTGYAGVGQGVGAILQTKEGYHLFVDGGSSNVGKVGTYRILPFLKYKGVKRIDCWVVSHTDEDHISGLREILSSGYPVEYLAVAEQMPRDENWEELEALAEDAGTKVVWLGRGDIWHFGNATFTALHPGETEDAFGGQSVDKNEESLVLFYQEDDFAGVFTGDIGAAQEEEILTWLQKTKTGADVQKIDFYKAAHHGSRYSNSTGFLEALAPEIALVSCSRTNRYGHPSKEAVGHMQQAGSQVYYTMESGRLCVKKTDGQAVCRGYLEEKEQWWQ